MSSISRVSSFHDHISVKNVCMQCTRQPAFMRPTSHGTLSRHFGGGHLSLQQAPTSGLWGEKNPRININKLDKTHSSLDFYHIQLLSFWEILALFLLRMILHYSINSSWTWSGIHHRNISNNLIIPQSLHLKKKKEFL